MNKKLFEIILRFRIGIIIFLLAVIGFSLFELTNLKIDNSLEIWFFNNDPVLISYRYFQKTFGNDETIAVAITGKKEFSKNNIPDSINRIVSELRTLKYVKNIYYLKNSPIKSSVLSKDNRTMMLYIELERIADIDSLRPLIINSVKTILSKLNNTDYKYHLGGIGVVYNELNKITLKDSNIFITLNYIFIFLILAFFIKRVKFVIPAVITVLLNIIVVMGIFAAAGKSINMVSMVLPTIVMIFSVADVIHFINGYFLQASEKKIQTNQENLSDKKNIISDAFGSLVVPCFLTSLTTAIGFSALIFTRMQIIREFGLFAAIGVIIEFIMSILILPIWFSFLRVPIDKEKIGLFHKNFLEKVLWVLKNHLKKILIITLVLFIILLPGLFLIKVDTSSIGFLKRDNPVRVSSRYIEKHFGYYTPAEFLLRTSKGTFLDKDNLVLCAKFRNIVNSTKNITGAFTLTDFIPFFDEYTSQKNIDQVLSFFNDDELSLILSKDKKTIRITARVKMMSALGFKRVIESIKMRAKNELPDSIEIIPSGYLPLYVKMIEYITNTQIYSFLIAFLLVFLITGIYAGSFVLALFALLSNIFPLGITMGIMGYSGIRLDIATVTISAIAIGIVVDDTIHFLYRFKKGSYKGITKALDITILDTAQAIISTSIILILGFSITIFASVKSISYFGLLSVIVVFAALIGDILILPALILQFKKT